MSPPSTWRRSLRPVGAIKPSNDATLLGWRIVEESPGWAVIRPPSGGTGPSFQRESEFEPPVWPRRPGRPQLGAHVDIAVDDLAAAVALAVELGASVRCVGRQGVEDGVDPTRGTSLVAGSGLLEFLTSKRNQRAEGRARVGKLAILDRQQVARVLAIF